MALPQKAIEQLSREPVQTPGWSSRILMVTSTLFFFALATYFGMRFGYVPYLNRELAAIKNKIQRLDQRIPLASQEKLIHFYSQLVNVEQLLKKQKMVSAIFPWLERNTQFNISFSQFGFAAEAGRVNLTGTGRTIGDIAQQLASLEGVKELKEFTFSGVSFNKEEQSWSFRLQLTFIPGFFTNPEAFLSGAIE